MKRLFLMLLAACLSLGFSSPIKAAGENGGLKQGYYNESLTAEQRSAMDLFRSNYRLLEQAKAQCEREPKNSKASSLKTRLASDNREILSRYGWVFKDGCFYDDRDNLIGYLDTYGSIPQASFNTDKEKEAENVINTQTNQVAPSNTANVATYPAVPVSQTLTPIWDIFDIYNSVKPTSITLSKDSLSMVVGESAALSATIYPSNATDKNVYWSSSNGNVATVSNGRIYGVATGSATITARTSNGLSAYCSVNVVAKQETITPEEPSSPVNPVIPSQPAQQTTTVSEELARHLAVIEDLNNALSEYRTIINDEIKEVKRKTTPYAGSEADYTKKRNKLISDISKTQTKIDSYRLDTSRDAQVKRLNLEEELAGLQDELADLQARYSAKAKIASLESMYDEFKLTVDQRKAEENKLYQENLARIKNQ